MSNQRRPQGPRIRRKWYDSPWTIFGQAIAVAIGCVVIAAVVAIVVIPKLTGGDSLTVLTGSMEPTFSPGDVVVVRGIEQSEVCTDINVGAIVTYLPKANDPSLITHRVIGKTIGTFDDGTLCRLLTQGDANSAVDLPVSPAQVRGVFLYGVPKLGWVREWVAGNTQTLGIIAVAVFIGWWFLGGRRAKTRIYSIPSQPGSEPSQLNPISPMPGNPGSPYTDRERKLRERELDLRERELALREQELALLRLPADNVVGAPDNTHNSSVPSEAICPSATDS